MQLHSFLFFWRVCVCVCVHGAGEVKLLSSLIRGWTPLRMVTIDPHYLNHASNCGGSMAFSIVKTIAFKRKYYSAFLCISKNIPVASFKPAGLVQIAAAQLPLLLQKTWQYIPYLTTDLHKQWINQNADPTTYLLVCLSLLHGSNHHSNMRPFLIHLLSLLCLSLSLYRLLLTL